MLWPVLRPLCFGGAAAPAGDGAAPALAPALVGVAIHTAAMLTVTAAVAGAVYEWLGPEMLRRAWVNVDAVWVGAPAATGAWLVLSAA
jgi:hypothetical protein